MKQLLILLMVCFVGVGCTHKRSGEIIKTQDGKFYKLKDAAPNESYIFEEVDTAAINKLSQ